MFQLQREHRLATGVNALMHFFTKGAMSPGESFALLGNKHRFMQLLCAEKCDSN
jgi:hypothetical protein